MDKNTLKVRTSHNNENCLGIKITINFKCIHDFFYFLILFIYLILAILVPYKTVKAIFINLPLIVIVPLVHTVNECKQDYFEYTIRPDNVDIDQKMDGYDASSSTLQ